MTRLTETGYPHPLSLSLSTFASVFSSQTHPLFETPTSTPSASSPAFPPSLPLLLIADLYAGGDLGGYKAPHIILDHSSAPREASYEERSLNDALTINSVLCPNVSLLLRTNWSNIDTRNQGIYIEKILV